MSGQARLLIAFAVVIGALLSAALMGQFIGDFPSMVLSLLAGVAILFLVICIIIQALWGATRRKFAIAAAALAAGALSVTLGVPIAWVGADRLFFLSRRAALNAFVRDAQMYQRIHDMSDGERYFVDLNGTSVVGGTADTLVPTAESRPDHPVPLARVLARDRIDPRRYEGFRQRLVALGLIQFEMRPDHVAFVYDGLLNRIHGYLYVLPGARAPKSGAQVFNEELGGLNPLSGGWYTFGAR